MIKMLTNATATVFGGMISLVLIALPIIVIVLAIVVGVVFQDVIQWVNNVLGILFFLLLFLSIVPRFRAVTGSLIVLEAYAWFLVLWINCAVVTYAMWGVWGIVIGILLAGIGVYITAILAALFSGEFAIAGIIILTLAIIMGIQALGLWISTKHKSKYRA